MYNFRMPNATLDELAKEILADAVADFRLKNLESASLSADYEGPSIGDLKAKFCLRGGYSQVDFDLALKELEDNKLLKTGPMVAHQNTPNSGVFIMGLYSKREYVYLTEKGYKEAQKPASKPRAPTTHVNISGGTFQNSPFAVGTNINQTTSINIKNDQEVIGYLSKLHAEHNQPLSSKAREEIIQMVDAAKAGDSAKAMPIFKRLFGAASETAKGLAYAVIAEYLKASFGG
jgi:hypothetical protein